MTQIKNNQLPKLSDTNSASIHNWRRHGYLPKGKLIDARWVAVVRQVNRMSAKGFRRQAAFQQAVASVFRQS